MKLLVAVINVSLILFLFYKIWGSEKSSLRKFFWPALILKLGAGICLGLVYMYYYEVGDTFGYFQDGVSLAQLAKTDPESYILFLWSGDESFPVWSGLNFQQPRALFLSKITSVFCLLTLNNYWVISLYFSAITFFSSWALVKKISNIQPSAEIAAIIAFLFFPSMVFWSSGLIKESLAMAALFFLSILFLKAWCKKIPSFVEWLLMGIACWLLWNLKYYYIAVFLPVALTTLVVRFLVSRIKLKSLATKIVLWAFVFFVPLLLVSILHPNFYPHRFMDVVVSSYYEFQTISNPDDMIFYNSLEASPWSIVKNIPFALLSGLFRPFITEAYGALQVVSAIENLVLLVLFLFAFGGVNNLVKTRYRLIFFSIIIYTIILCIFLALSTPNFGTLSRYRVGFLPFLVFLLTVENPLINKLMTSKIMVRLVP